MAKVIVEDLKRRSTRSRPPGVKEQRFRSENGGWTIVRTLDANSATFADDFTYVFAKNVAKARRENRKIIGSADGIPRKR